MKYTPNYGLKKPEQDDFYNVEDFNENADIIDEKLKEIEDGIKNIDAPVTSVNEKTGDVVLTAEDVGAETPTGAQAKVDAHNSQTNVHGATSAATANRIIMRDSAGRAKVAAPSASDDIARKDTVDTHANSKQTHGISSGYYIAKTSRSDQLPEWNDIQGKPDLALASDLAAHQAKTASINAIGHVYAAEFTATLSTSWSGSAAPYTQTVTINGITSAHNPIIDVVLSGTYSTDQQRIEQWGYIYRAVTGTNQITFYASEKPTVSLPIRVKVVM